MRNSKVLALLLLLILLYCGLRIATWNYPVASSLTGSLDWWLCIAREISFYLMSILLIKELWKQKPLRQRVLMGRFGRQYSKLDFVLGVIAFILILAAIALVIVPYRARVERAMDSGVSLSAESNVNLQRDE